MQRGGQREVMEGRMRARNVLREFDSFDVAVAAYSTPEYTRAHALREGHAACDFLIVEGYDGPQPPAVGPQPAPAKLKGYWVAHVDVTDMEGYKQYMAANQKPFGMFTKEQVDAFAESSKQMKEAMHEFQIAAVPLAMSWMLSPVVAGAAMAFSSVFVVSNSLRLRRFRPG